MSDRFVDEAEEQRETSQLSEMADELSFQRFRVEVVEGADVGKSVISSADELSIGCAVGNDLVLSDGSVSRHHCVIVESPKGSWLRDQGSTNGIVIGGFKVGSVKLKAGATFRLGRTTLRFDSLDDAVSQPLSRTDRFADVLGRSAAMRRIFAMLPRVAAVDSTVLLEGETGTGKGLLASAIHDASPRHAAPYVVVDCAAMTPTLIESQLFGHKKGAYTGAHSDRSGAFEAARRGTLFLDEIGELPLEMQPKLLRVLEERVVTPLGTTRAIPIDVRIVAATNRDLREEVNRGTFRADLFYRLNVVRLRVPPLRERPEDIELLVEHFFRECAPMSPTPPAGLVDTYKQLRWSGNVRELRAAVERTVLLGDASLDLGVEAAREGSAPGRADQQADQAMPFRIAKDRVVARFEREYLAAVIERHGGNISQAARAAQMDRNHLRELLRRHGIGPGV